VAVPTITSVTPATGPLFGDTLVEIVGTNFVVPPLTPGGEVPPTAVVLLGGIAATQIEVLSATTLRCVVPRRKTLGPVAVSVQNLDTHGAPIAGEFVSVTNAFTYAPLRSTSDEEVNGGELVRLARALLLEMINEFGNVDVTFAVQTDYDETTGDELHVTKFAKLPAFTVIGPNLRENRFYSLNEEPSFPGTAKDSDGEPIDFVDTRVPYTVDVMWTVIGASSSKMELMNMMTNFVAFMHKTKFLTLDRDPADPTKGTVQYELDFQSGGQPTSTTTANNSNIRSFSAEILVRGFDIEIPAGVGGGTTFGVPNQAIVRRGKTMDELVLDPISSLPEP